MIHKVPKRTSHSLQSGVPDHVGLITKRITGRLRRTITRAAIVFGYVERVCTMSTDREA